MQINLNLCIFSYRCISEFMLNIQDYIKRTWIEPYVTEKYFCKNKILYKLYYEIWYYNLACLIMSCKGLHIRQINVLESTHIV